ncbi:MAG: hypothetical protein Q8Q09_06030 [Deltaproteobacteria bacterium]|nr:hypothetical protein [Deltaproteobacteria bacterium]
MQIAPRTRPAGSKLVPINRAQWQRRQQTAGRDNWFHWLDVELARAWANESIRLFDALLERFGASDALASWFEGRQGTETVFILAIKGALQALVHGFSAVNTPAVLSVEHRAKRQEILASRVSYNPADLLRVHTAITGLEIFNDVIRAFLDPALQRATTAVMGSGELDSDSGIVKDVVSRQTVFRGSFEASRQWISTQSDATRGRLAWRGRRPWSLLGYDTDGFEFEYETRTALWTQREQWLAHVRTLRETAARMAQDPWAFVVGHRSTISAHNERMARAWGGSTELFHPGTDPRAVAAFLDIVSQMANAKSATDLHASRERFVRDMRSGSSTLTTVASAITGGVSGLVLSAATEFYAFLTRSIPREWLSVAETLPPPLPLPFMIDGTEAATGAPTIAVPAPAGFSRTGISPTSPALLQLTMQQPNALLSLLAPTVQPTLQPTLQPTAAQRYVITATPTATPPAAPLESASIALGAGALVGTGALVWWLLRR